MGCIETKDYVSKIHKHINENNICLFNSKLQKLNIKQAAAWPILLV